MLVAMMLFTVVSAVFPTAVSAVWEMLWSRDQRMTTCCTSNIDILFWYLCCEWNVNSPFTFLLSLVSIFLFYVVFQDGQVGSCNRLVFLVGSLRAFHPHLLVGQGMVKVLPWLIGTCISYWSLMHSLLNAVMMDAERTSEILVNFHQTA
jgi:hypothetical protein